MFCAAHLGLINQTIDRFRAEGIDDLGLVQSDHLLTRPDALVQICSIQTLKRRSIPKAGIVFIDECHVWHEAHSEWITAPEWEDVPFLGLSASPWRKGLGKYFQKLVKISTTQELIDHGYLCAFRAFAPSHPDLRGVSTFGGEFHQGELARAMCKPKLVGDVVSTYLRLANAGMVLFLPSIVRMRKSCRSNSMRRASHAGTLTRTQVRKTARQSSKPTKKEKYS